jgi:hypothetical protein
MWKAGRAGKAPLSSDFQIHAIGAKAIWDSGNQAQASLGLFPAFHIAGLLNVESWKSWKQAADSDISFSLVMKPLTKILFSMAALAVGFGAPRGHAAVASGQPAPDFTVTDIAGKTQKLSAYRGKIVVLEWVSPGCPYVLRLYRSGSMPSTQAVAGVAGAVWLQINSGSAGDLDAAKTVEWQKKQGAVATAYIRDESGRLGRLYGAETTPHLYVIAPDGTLAYQGAIDDQPSASLANTTAAHNYVKAALAALREGRSVQTATTKPYGCGVKYGAER